MLFRLLVVFFLVTAGALAVPQNLVFEGEYVVVRKKGVPVVRGKSGYSFVKSLAQGIDLVQVGPHTRGASREANIVEYDSEHDHCRSISQDPGVLVCSPNFVVHASSFFNPHKSLSKVPSAKSFSRGSISDRVVAVLDTGFDYSHPALSKHLWNNPFEIPDNGIDDDGNGYIDDVHGANVYSGSGDPFDDNGHGTHVAGIVAKQLHSSGSETKIMALKFLNERGMGGVAGAIQAMNYLLDLKSRGVDVRVSNNSWGGAPYSQPLEDAVRRVIGSGIAFVAAAGNVGGNNDIYPEYPASFNFPEVISVAAVDGQGNLASFSNYGEGSVDVAALGVRVISAFPGGGQQSMSGTSMAAPLVAGVLAVHAEMGNGATTQAISSLYSKAVSLSSLDGFVFRRRLVVGAGEEPPSTSVQPKKDDLMVSTVSLLGLSSNGIERSFVKSGFALKVVGLGEGAGTASVELAIEGQFKCAEDFNMDVVDGMGELVVQLPRIPSGIRFFTVSVAGVKERIKVRTKVKRSRRLGKRSKRLKRRARSVCERVNFS